MKRYEKSVYVDDKHVCSENYANPPIPNNFFHKEGEWNNGFVISKRMDGSQFVWIPVGYLDPNGTLDGVSFTEKFGRRNYRNNEFSEGQFHETLTDELALQIESVKKYGGFYISRYNISMNRWGLPNSAEKCMPWTKIDFNDAKKIASVMVDTWDVKSHLTFGAEYDSVLEWFIKSKARTRSEIVEDSTNWGHYYDLNDKKMIYDKILKTGSRKKWCTNNIYDFAGNVQELTQEEKGNSNRVIRGGTYDMYGKNAPAAFRSFVGPNYPCYSTGFRISLWIR